MSVQPRLIQTDGHAVLSGVQMIVKAALESGIDTLIGSQLDSPPAYTDLLHDHAPLFEDKGLRILTLPDARQAVTALRSAWLAGHRVVGLCQAIGVIDAASVLLASDPTDNAEPGTVLLAFGDSDTSAGQAATALLRRAGWVVIEPALQDEVKSFCINGLSISAVSGRPVALALPGVMAHGAATVPCGPNIYPGTRTEAITDRASENVEPLTAVLAEARAAKINTVVNPPGKDEALPLALIAVGRAFGWARQAMAELGLVGRIPMLRLGMLAPLDPVAIRRHISACRRVLVLDPSAIGVAKDVSERAKQQAHDHDPDHDAPEPQPVEVLPIALEPEAGPAGVIQQLRPWLESHPTLPRELVALGLERVGQAMPGNSEHPSTAYELTKRGTTPPPGSSLVDLSVVLGRLKRDLADAQRMLELHRSPPVDLSIFGELDDASRLLLTRWSPLKGGLACDGRLSGAAAAGAGDSPTHRSVVLMTSRRFFSLGVSAIADAVRAGRSAVFVIHTEDPAEAVGPRRRFRRRPKANALDMQAIVQAVGVGRRDPAPSVTTIDPADRPRLSRLLERLVLNAGVHVVIARRRRGPRYYRKASEVHQKQSARRGYVARQGCLVHCPEAGPLTPRRRVELGVLGVEATDAAPDPWTVSVSWSWHDETVMHALAEPSVGLAILERSQPERSRVVAEDLDGLPDPPRPLHASADAWRATLAGITGTAFDLTLELILEAGAAMGYLVRSTHAPEPTDEPAARRADILFTRREVTDGPIVPAAPGRSASPMFTATPLPGHADLILATELTEAARILTHEQAPASNSNAYILADTLRIPDINTLATGQLPDRDTLIQLIAKLETDQGDQQQIASQSDQSDKQANKAVLSQRAATLPIARLAEWFWGHQRYAAWVYLGYLVQRGLIPLTTTAIDAAGVRVLGVTDPRSAEAVKVGRKLALDPGYAKRVLADQPPALDSLIKTLADDLAEQAGSGKGTALAGTFQALVQPLVEQTHPLGDAVQRQLLNTAQRCVLWAGHKHGPAYCKRFVDSLQHILAIDSPDRGFALTRAAIDGLSRAMLIPDEVYLAALLTAPARFRRDRRRLNISLERGDRISYVHILRPEFDLFKRRVGFSITLGERALRFIAGLYSIRRIRPGWYRAQRDFRDLYLQSLNDLPEPKTDNAYRHARDLAATPTPILGRGENRRESVKTARRKLEKLLSGADAP